MNSPSGEIFTPPNSSKFVKCSSGSGPERRKGGRSLREPDGVDERADQRAEEKPEVTHVKLPAPGVF